MRGHEAFDRLVEMGCMSVGETGKGKIVKAPKGKKALDEFVRLVKTLGAYSVSTGRSEATIGVERGHSSDELHFSKR